MTKCFAAAMSNAVMHNVTFIGQSEWCMNCWNNKTDESKITSSTGSGNLGKTSFKDDKLWLNKVILIYHQIIKVRRDNFILF